jgi:hypothetical protein
MAVDTILCDLAADAQGDATASLLDGGRCDAFDGDPPTDGADALASAAAQSLCFSLGFGTPAFMPSSGGVIVANQMRAGVVVCDVPASGIPRKARWFCAYSAAGEPVLLGNIGTKDAAMLVASMLMVPGTLINPRSFTHAIPKRLAPSARQD